MPRAVLLAALGTAFVVECVVVATVAAPGVERRLLESARAALAEAGVPPEAASAAGRVILIDESVAGADAARAREVVAGVAGVLRVQCASRPSTAALRPSASPAATRAASYVIHLGPDQLYVGGLASSDEERRALVEALWTVDPRLRLVDDIEVAEGVSPGPPPGTVVAVVELVAATLFRASCTITSSAIEVEGTATREADRQRVLQLIATAAPGYRLREAIAVVIPGKGES